MPLRLGYRLKSLSTEDFALARVRPDTIAQRITLGESGPENAVRVIGASFSYSF
jgi:hypothetical protein